VLNGLDDGSFGGSAVQVGKTQGIIRIWGYIGKGIELYPRSIEFQGFDVQQFASIAGGENVELCDMGIEKTLGDIYGNQGSFDLKFRFLHRFISQAVPGLHPKAGIPVRILIRMEAPTCSSGGQVRNKGVVDEQLQRSAEHT